MKIRIFLLLLFSFLSTSLIAQTFQWARGMGGVNQDNGLCIALDKQSNVYTSGSFRNQADFNPGAAVFSMTAQGLSDIFVSKLDSNGNFIWAKGMGGSSYCEAYGITTDQNNNVIVTGSFQGNADLDPNAGLANVVSAGDRDIFITKLDANGDFVWGKSIGGMLTDESYAICADTFGNLYITGTFSGSVDFDPGIGVFPLNASYSGKIFILKLDANGDFVYAKDLGGVSGGGGFTIAVDKSKHVYAAGVFWGSGDFDPDPIGVYTLSALGGSDIFITKLDSVGNFLKAIQISGASDERIYAMDIDSNERIYATGLFQGSTDFNPGTAVNSLTAVGYQDIFILSLDSAGNYAWAKKIGSTGPDRGNAIKIDHEGNIITTGSFYYTADFNPNAGVYNLTSSGMSDIFISKLSATGDFIYAKQMGGPQFGGGGDQKGYGLALDNTGSIYSVGLFQNASDFNPGMDTAMLYSAGGNDIYVSKIRPCADSFFYTYVACDSIVVGGLTYTTSGVYTSMYENANGCDSIVSLLISISHAAVTSLSSNACNSITINAQTYTVSGMYTQSFISSAGCDSTLILTLTINNTSSHTLYDTACHSYLFNAQTYTSSGIYTQTLVNAVGCDSIITINLIIHQADTSIIQTGLTLTANASSATYQWIDCNGNKIIVGASNQTFTATANGSYALVITQNACTDTSSCHTLSGVGLNHYDCDEQIQVFPNPNTGCFTLTSKTRLRNADVEITDITGKRIEKKIYPEFQSAQFQITQSVGIYFLLLEYEGMKRVWKLVKE